MFGGHMVELNPPVRFEFGGAPVAQARMQSLAVLEHLDPFKDGLPRLVARGVLSGLGLLRRLLDPRR